MSNQNNVLTPGGQTSGGNSAFSDMAERASGQLSQVQICANVGRSEGAGTNVGL